MVPSNYLDGSIVGCEGEGAYDGAVGADVGVREGRLRQNERQTDKGRMRCVRIDL